MSRKGRKSEVFSEMIVGLFMITVILLLAYFTIVISGVDLFKGDRKVEIQVAFSDVGGLKNQDNVMYRGTKVGKVEEVMVAPSGLVVIASIDRNVVLRETAKFSVANLSMLGGNYLLLEEGEGNIVPFSTLFHGETPRDWMRDVSGLAKNLKELTEHPKIYSSITNIETVTIKADKMMDEATGALKDVRQVIDNFRDTTPISTFSALISGAL